MPNDKSKSLVTFDDMVELFNQLSIYIGSKEFKTMFWEVQPFLKQLLPNWKKTVCDIPSKVQVWKASLGQEELDLKRYPSIGPGAYTVEEVRWCDATYDFLVSQLDDEGRAKHSIPLRTRHPAAGRLQAAKAAAQAPAADQYVEMEDEGPRPLRWQLNLKCRRSARWAIFSTK